MSAMPAKGMPASAANVASGCWVMLITCHPADRYHMDSARVANRGPPMTTTVPPSWTAKPLCPSDVDEDGPESFVVGIGDRDVLGSVAEVVVEGVRPPRGAIDELVDDDEITGMDLGAERTRSERGEQGRSPRASAWRRCSPGS